MCQPIRDEPLDPKSLPGAGPMNMNIHMNQLDIPKLQRQLDSSHQIATARIMAIRDEIYGGLASPLVLILSAGVMEWMSLFQHGRGHGYVQDQDQEEKKDFSDSNVVDADEYAYVAKAKETMVLKKILSLILNICQKDATLCEEMAKAGAHVQLSKIIRMDVYSILSMMNIPVTCAHHTTATATATVTQEIYEVEEDMLIEMQDLACEVAHSSPDVRYPTRISPCVNEEFFSRLPLTFDIRSPMGVQESLMVRQVTERQSAQEDVGFVMWPSAVVLASWLLDNQDVLRGKSILEIGAGCGLTGLVAARIVQNMDRQCIVDGTRSDLKSSRMILSDYNRKVLTNIDRNIELNGLRQFCNASRLDFYVQEGSNRDGGWKGVDIQSLNVQGGECVDSIQPAVDLILAADIICKPSDSVAASNTIHDALCPGGEAIVVLGDGKHRFGVDIFEEECHRNGLEVHATNVADMCGGQLLPKTIESDDPCGLRKTSGFVEGMTLTMFRVKKAL
mmetsp:Transcript_20171/g.29667  ORF Transcript_20171/g.29667 Transcript_20171/m.29667 type:complete len:505 (+) Transcript_20171:71-1585(+)